MTPGPVVEDFNVIEDIGPGQIPGFIDTFSDPFFFSELKNDSATALSQQLPRRLMLGAVVIGPAEALPVVTAVLAALIAMYDNLAVRFSTPHGHHQSVQREFARESGLHRPANHVTGEEIDNHRQIQPALPVRI
ncbi:hypothetical protein PDTA9734_06960 [Phytobacter diazotrophicus]|uniref:Uncharacterized protein n=1 Tax=Phytobacter diazotrophicus TaxID=395631 RepID=A0ABN6LJ43_9ENTR|nr:hypothetical protein PDTA9734_06960 [Phytobacter diazotrophicus]